MDPQNTPASGEPRENSITPPRSLFAEDAPGTPQPPPDSQAAPSVARKPFNIVTRVVLPLVVFVVGIAVIAWVAQELPSWRAKTPAIEGKGGEARDMLSFRQEVWNNESRGYVAEYEVDTSGFHDFPFENKTGKDLDVGIADTNCQCAKVQICVLDAKQRSAYEKAVMEGKPDAADDQITWVKQAADKELKQSIAVPAEAAGILRVFWKGKSEPANQGITVTVWSRAAGTGRERSIKVLALGITYVGPVLFDTDKVDFGIVGPQQKTSGSFLCYSISRDLEVKPTSKDKRVVVEVIPLKGKEFEKKNYPVLGAGTVGLVGWLCDQGPFFAASYALLGADEVPEILRAHKRVASAFRVNVTLFEERDGKQLDLGLFKEDVPLAITSQGKPIEPANSVILPTLRATVRGDVALQLPPEDGGRINFGLFKVADGKRQKVAIWAPKGTALTFVRCEPALLDLDVKLKELAPVSNQSRWEMDVAIRAGGAAGAGPLPEDGVIVLRCVLPAQGSSPSVTRMARIPVVGSGTAVQH
jgi:hypothetical protein